MLYELGYVSRLEAGSVATSDPVVILGDGLIDIATTRGQLIVDGVASGPTAQVTEGAVVNIEATSGGQLGVPVFAQLRQNGQVEGTFVLINRPDVEFTYNDALNGLYAWEVLPESTWVASDNGRVGSYDFETDTLSYTSLGDQAIDLSRTELLRNRLNLLDYYLDHINVFTLQGEFLGRVDTEFSGPIDSTTLYSPDTDSRILTIVAFELSSKVVLYNSAYESVLDIDHTSPVATAALNNRLHIASRDSNDLRIVEFDTLGAITGDTTITLPRQPHRLYQINDDIAVLTQTSIDFVDGTGAIRDSISLPPFASSLAYAPELDRVWVTHRQGRQITSIDLDFDGTHTIATFDVTNSGYVDAVVWDRIHQRWFVSDVVTNELHVYAATGGKIRTVELEQHSYEMYSVLTDGRIILNSLYPDIDTRLIISDSDPDPQEYFPVTEIPIGGFKLSPEYVLTGIRDPVTLYLYPDDEPLVNTQIKVGENTFAAGAVIGVDQPFQFQVSIDGGRAREINFVLGQSVYRFGASPDTLRRIPEFHIYEPVEYANPGATVSSNTITVSGLDVQPASIATDGVATIYKNNVIQGTSTTIVNGDQIRLTMPAGPDACDRRISQITYAGIFTTSWKVTTATAGEAQTVGQPEFDDFVDVFAGDLNTEYLSEPVVITLPDGVTQADATITTDYAATMVVNGSPVGQSATLVDGDSVQLRLNTTNLLGTDHQVTLSLCKLSQTWVVTTLPAVNIIPLDFGVIEGVTNGDLVQSETLTLDTVSPRFFTDVSIPAGVVPIVNGSYFPLGNRQVNYKGVLRYPTTISVRGESTLQLEGYASGRYGTLSIYDVRAGLSRGSWSIRSVETTESLDGRNGSAELVEFRIPEVIEQQESLVDGGTWEGLHEIELHAAVGYDAPTYQQDATLVVEDNYQGIDVIQDGPIYLLDSDPAIYNRVVSRPIEMVPGTFNKIVPHHRQIAGQIKGTMHGSQHAPVIDMNQRGYLKSNRGVGSFDYGTYQVTYQNRRLVVNPTWTFQKTSATSPVVDIMRQFVQSIPHQPLVTEETTEFYKSESQRQGIDDSKAYVKQHEGTLADFAKAYEWFDYSTVTFDTEYDRAFRNDAKLFESEYQRNGTSETASINIPYARFSAFATVDFSTPFRKYNLASLANIMPQWVKSQFTTESTWSWTDPLVEVNVIHGPKVLTNTVNTRTEVGTLSNPQIYDPEYNLSVVFDYSKPLVRNPDVEFDYRHHHEIQTLVPQFVPMDTFTFTTLDMSPVVITEDDCAKLGNDNCLEIGYFATPEDARADAVDNWGVPSQDVNVFEVEPGCWAWSQSLPCVNSCFECPSTGYIQGG
jgi:hypothetical protein